MAFETKLFIIALVFVSPTVYFLAATLLLFRLLRTNEKIFSSSDSNICCYDSVDLYDCPCH